MRKIVLLIMGALLTACTTPELHPRRLEYAIHYPDGVSYKTYDYKGDSTANGYVRVDRRGRKHILYLRFTENPFRFGEIDESSCPIEVISNKPITTKEEKDD